MTASVTSRCRASGRRRAIGRGRFRHRHPSELGNGDGGCSQGRRKARSRFGGVSNIPLGGLGFVGFAEEVVGQETELVSNRLHRGLLGHGSTQAGMMVGFAADGRADAVIGIDASARRQRPGRRSCVSHRTPPNWSNWAARSPTRIWYSTPLSGPHMPAQRRHDGGHPPLRTAGRRADRPVYEASPCTVINMVRLGSSAGLQSAVRPPWAACLH